MKTPKVFLFTLCFIITGYANSQTITKTTASNVTGTVCPVSGTGYSVSIPTNFGSCKIKWTVTGGVINGSDNMPTVNVAWNDVRGLTAIIKVTFSGCGEGNPNEGLNDTKSELILSVKDRPFDSFSNNLINLDFCNPPQSIPITVPEMIVEGTGGFGQPARTEAVYLWNLPTGWKDFTTGKTGEFGTTTRSITIVPLACAEPGVIVVKGSLRGSQGCGSSAFSAPANISINASPLPPVVSVVPPQGFTGTTACNTTPVTFTAQIANQGNCSISSYVWAHTSSWSFVSQSGNTITLRPTGAASDASAISCKVTFGCGSDRTGSFTPAFNLPVISGTSPVCSSSNFTVGNAQGLSITWASSNTSIATINSSGVLSAVSNASGYTTLNATLPCAVTVAPKNVWVGKPYDFLVEGATLVTAGSYNSYNMKKWGTPPNPIYLPFTEQGVGVNGFTWSFGLPSTSAGWDCFSCTGEYITIKAGSLSTWVTAHVENTCGITTRNYEVFVEQEGCPPGGCEEPYIIYPNPSSEELMISSTSSDGNSNLSSVTLVDSNGTIVYVNQPDKSKRNLKIPVKEFKNGIYYLTTIQNGKTVQKKIVIKH